MENDGDFDQNFWRHYPRKVAKAHAMKMWRRLTSEEKFAATQAIPIHARFWKIAGTPVEKIPHAGTWLNPEEGRRWEDELEMPEASSGNDWMKTQSGIAAKALEIGITAKAGEGWMELKARVLGAMKAA